MKNIKFLIVIAVVSLFFNACKKDVDPKYHFTEEQKKQALYYSYKTGDTLCLLKNEIDTLVLIVNQKQLREYIPPSGTRAPLNEELNILLNHGNIFAQVKADNNYFVNINFFEISGSRNISDTILKKLEIDSVTYSNVYVYYNAAIPSDKIYANEKYGIIKAENDTVSYTLIP